MYDFNPATIASVYTVVDGPVLSLMGITCEGDHRVLGDFDNIRDLDYWMAHLMDIYDYTYANA